MGGDGPHQHRGVRRVEAQPGVGHRPPGGAASASPWSVSGTSCQPVNRFSRFHVLWPWRRVTSVPGMPPIVRRGTLGLNHDFSDQIYEDLR